MGASMTAWAYATGGSVGSALWQGAATGLLFGLLVGPSTARSHARRRALLGDIPAHRQAAVQRAAKRGRVPDEPGERAAAARLAALLLAESRRERRWSLVPVGALLLSAGYAVAASPWWWLAVLFFAGQLGWSLRQPGHLQRRLALLQAEAPAPARS